MSKFYGEEMNIFETIGLIHVIFYSCAGLVWVSKSVIKGLVAQDKDNEVTFFKKSLS